MMTLDRGVSNEGGRQGLVVAVPVVIISHASAKHTLTSSAGCPCQKGSAGERKKALA